MLKHCLSFSLLLFLFSCLSAQESAFPEPWAGKWTGTLKIYRVAEVVNEVPMELHILPLDTTDGYTWTLIYGEDKEAGKRPYELKTVDAEKGIYLIDEKNTIAMEAYVIGGKFFNRFEVADNLLLVTTEMIDGELIFEVISGSLEPVSTTGGQEFEGEDIPPVKALPIVVMQRAVLKRS